MKYVVILFSLLAVCAAQRRVRQNPSQRSEVYQVPNWRRSFDVKQRPYGQRIRNPFKQRVKTTTSRPQTWPIPPITRPPATTSKPRNTTRASLKNINDPNSPYALLHKYFVTFDAANISTTPVPTLAPEDNPEGEFNANDLGGLNENEVFRVDGSLLVIKGGEFPNNYTAEQPDQPIDDYQAPYREPKLPPPGYDFGYGPGFGPDGIPFPEPPFGFHQVDPYAILNSPRGNNKSGIYIPEGPPLGVYPPYYPEFPSDPYNPDFADPYGPPVGGPYGPPGGPNSGPPFSDPYPPFYPDPYYPEDNSSDPYIPNNAIPKNNSQPYPSFYPPEPKYPEYQNRSHQNNISDPYYFDPYYYPESFTRSNIENSTNSIYNNFYNVFPENNRKPLASKQTSKIISTTQHSRPKPHATTFRPRHTSQHRKNRILLQHNIPKYRSFRQRVIKPKKPSQQTQAYNPTSRPRYENEDIILSNLGFTDFGKRIIYKNRPVKRRIVEEPKSKPISLHKDTLVNFKEPLPKINPLSEPVPGFRRFQRRRLPIRPRLRVRQRQQTRTRVPERTTPRTRATQRWERATESGDKSTVVKVYYRLQAPEHAMSYSYSW